MLGARAESRTTKLGAGWRPVRLGLASDGGPFAAELTDAGFEVLRGLGYATEVLALRGDRPAPPVCRAREARAVAKGIRALVQPCDGCGAKRFQACSEEAPPTAHRPQSRAASSLRDLSRPIHVRIADVGEAFFSAGLPRLTMTCPPVSRAILEAQARRLAHPPEAPSCRR